MTNMPTIYAFVSVFVQINDLLFLTIGITHISATNASSGI